MHGLASPLAIGVLTSATWTVGYWLWSRRAPSAKQRLLEACDDLTLAWLKDPKWVELSQATKEAFLRLEEAKGAARRDFS